MYYPTFSKAGVPTVVIFDAGVLSPSATLLQTNQSFQLSEGRIPYIYTYASPTRYLTFAFSGIEQATYDDLLTFLAHPLVNYQELPFTYTDHLDAQHTVQLAAGDIQFQVYSTALYAFTLPLLVRS